MLTFFSKQIILKQGLLVMKKSMKIFILFILILSCIACDESTKKLARENLKNRKPIIFMNDLFRLEYAENSGAFLSLGSDSSENIHFWILRIVPVAVLTALLFYIIFKIDKMDKMKLISFALIFSGGFGNIFDRFFNSRLVIDFMNMGIGNLRTGIFNFADLYITSGLILFLIASFSEERSRKNITKNKNS